MLYASNKKGCFHKMKISDMKLGDVAEIIGYNEGNATYRAKILALGLITGTKIKLINVAPLGDPVEFSLRGYHLSLRRDEANILQIKKI